MSEEINKAIENSLKLILERTPPLFVKPQLTKEQKNLRNRLKRRRKK